MTCNIKIITHLTEKTVKIVDMNGTLVNDSFSNKCINIPYDSYIVYMSNPIKITSFTSILTLLDNIFFQFFLFALLSIIFIVFIIFVQQIKKRGLSK